MKKDLLSVVIPSRNDPYLQRTVDDLLEHAEGDIEIIVVADGVWPDPPLKDNPKVLLIHHGLPDNNYGMRESINRGVAASKGKYIMKIDEHCNFDQGFDAKLKADCKDNWIVTPRKYNLDADNWTLMRGSAVDNMSFKYPYLDLYRVRSWTDLRKHILIDDCMIMQGSCYFMTRKHWDWLGGLDEEKYGKFHYESQEIVLKTWLGGGRVVTNKKTWYGHWYRQAKGYKFTNQQYADFVESKTKSTKFVHDYWFNNRWENRVHDFEWLIEKFWPVPYWPEDWKVKIHEASYGTPAS